MRKDSEKKKILEALRQQILHMQHLPAGSCTNEQSGLDVINEAFPNHIFPLAVHEFISDTMASVAATSGFIAALLGTIAPKGTYLWINANEIIFPPALTGFGIAPEQVIFVTIPNNKHRLWVIEEGLKSASIAAVVGEIRDLSFTESRRLQLAVEKSRIPGFLLRHQSRQLQSTACVSRWQIHALASYLPNNMPGVGFPCWDVSLQKMRGGKTGNWPLVWMNGQLQKRPDAVSAHPLQALKKIG